MLSFLFHLIIITSKSPAQAFGGATVCETILLPIIGGAEGSLAPQPYELIEKALVQCTEVIRKAKCDERTFFE